MQSRRALVTLLLVAVLVGAVVVTLAYVQLDPIRQYLGPDGGIRIRGTVSGPLLDYLQHGPRPGNQPHFKSVQDPFPTLRVEEDTFKLPSAGPPPAPDPYGSARVFGSVVSSYLDMAWSFVMDHWLGLKDVLLLGFDSLTLNATAACGGGGSNCYWISGTGTWTTNTHWSTTSGGASCACTPSTTDIANLDASSGGGTVSLAGATVIDTINTSGFTGSLSTGANYALTVRVFNLNVPLVAGSSTVAISGGMTIAAGTTAYITAASGSWSLTGGNWIDGSTNTANWSFGSGLTVTENTSPTITAGSHGTSNPEFGVLTIQPSGGASIVASLGADLNVSTTITINNGGSGSAQLDLSASNYALTAGGLVVGAGGSINARGSAVSMGNVTFSAATAYALLGTSSWTVSVVWSNSSTSASWAPGTSSVRFSSSAGSQTETFAGANLPVNEFYNLLFKTSVGSATWTMATNGLKVAATLTVDSFNGGAGLSTSTGNLPITAGALSLLEGGFLLANGSVVTINGNVSIGAATSYIKLGSSIWSVTGTWNNSSSSANWDAGTSKITFYMVNSESLGMDASLSVQEFYDLVFDTNVASGIISYSFPFAGTRTVHSLDVQSTGGASNQFAPSGTSGTVTGNVTGHAKGQIAVVITTLTVYGNWDQGTDQDANSGLYGQSSTVVFAGTAQNMFCPVNGVHAAFTNLTINQGTTVTTNVNRCTAAGTVTVNGTLKSQAALQQFTMDSSTLGGTAQPLVLGPQGDVHLQGMITYLACNNPSPKVVLVTPGTYYYLDMMACTGYTVKLAGNVQSWACGVANQCAALFSGYAVSDKPVFYTQGYSMNFPGIMWIGDISKGGEAHFQNSAITVGGLDAITGTIYLETATVNASEPPGGTACNGTQGFTTSIQALTTEGTGTIYGGSATVSAPGYCLQMNTPGPQAIYAQSAKLSFAYVMVQDANDSLDFGLSSWTLSGGINLAGLGPSFSWGAASLTFAPSGARSIIVGGSVTPGTLTVVTDSAGPTTISSVVWTVTALLGRLVSFTASGAGQVTFTLVGIAASSNYTLQVDGVATSQLTSSSNGVLSFTWGSWSTHAFEIDTGTCSTCIPPPPPPPPCFFNCGGDTTGNGTIPDGGFFTGGSGSGIFLDLILIALLIFGPVIAIRYLLSRRKPKSQGGVVIEVGGKSIRVSESEKERKPRRAKGAGR